MNDVIVFSLDIIKILLYGLSGVLILNIAVGSTIRVWVHTFWALTVEYDAINEKKKDVRKK